MEINEKIYPVFPLITCKKTMQKNTLARLPLHARHCFLCSIFCNDYHDQMMDLKGIHEEFA